jgi:hypothetical protein
MLASGPTFYRQATAWLQLLLVLGIALVAVGCKPKIGEDCAISTDCSLNGDRLCDITQPGGYCTVFNCEPNGCPDDATCVAFSEGTCSTVTVSTRLRRTFCMATCEDDGDCRGGDYRCIDTTNDPARTVVDVNASTRRICAVPTLAPPPDAGPPRRDPPSCYPSDATFDTSRPEAGPTTPDADVDAPEASRDDASGEPDITSTDREGDATDSPAVDTGADVSTDATDDDDATDYDATDDDATDGAEDVSID